MLCNPYLGFLEGAEAALPWSGGAQVGRSWPQEPRASPVQATCQYWRSGAASGRAPSTHAAAPPGPPVSRELWRALPWPLQTAQRRPPRLRLWRLGGQRSRALCLQAGSPPCGRGLQGTSGKLQEATLLSPSKGTGATVPQDSGRKSATHPGCATFLQWPALLVRSRLRAISPLPLSTGCCIVEKLRGSFLSEDNAYMHQRRFPIENHARLMRANCAPLNFAVQRRPSLGAQGEKRIFVEFFDEEKANHPHDHDFRLWSSCARRMQRGSPLTGRPV